MSGDGNLSSSPGQPSARADGTTDEGRRYWKAAIAHLAPQKREAAWEFYLDRLESSAAADTLGGVMLLLEAHIAFFDDLPTRLGMAAKQIESTLQPLSTSDVESRPSRPIVPPCPRSKRFPLATISVSALLGALVACAGMFTWLHQRLVLPGEQPATSQEMSLTRSHLIATEPWNDAVTHRKKGCVIRFGNTAATERTENGETKVYVLSPVEDVRQSLERLRRTAR